MNLKQKINIDVCKFIAALLVVAIHIYPFNSINPEFDYLFTRVFARVAVPFFLMVTGYFLLPNGITNTHQLKQYTKKILMIYGICILLYLPINIYTNEFSSISFLEILKKVLIDGTFYHLWYFPALILGIWITYFLIKKLDKKPVFIIVFLLYLIGLFGDSFYGFISEVKILKNIYDVIFMFSSYTRNGLFYVPIFLYLGYSFKNKDYKLTSNQNITLLIIYIILMEVEGLILYKYNIPRHNSMYILLLPLMFLLFNLLLKINNGSNKKLRKLSTLIYILHPLSIIIVRGIAKIINQENLMIYNNLIHYICVVILTLIISIVILKVKEVVNSEITKRKGYKI